MTHVYPGATARVASTEKAEKEAYFELIKIRFFFMERLAEFRPPQRAESDAICFF
jgi:hypothetical protein